MKRELPPVSLNDKYTLTAGRAYLSGLDALTRLLIMQRQRDAAAGLNTGGFISGYRGSPLAGFDTELQRARPFLEPNNIHFEPGLNEELAATAVWGSQQATLFPGATVDGVFGMWYGKGPGLDRSVDVFKHANMAGTARHGGVLVVAGDDHGCQSSTLPHQSEHIFQAAMMPVLHPAGVQEYLDFGLYGYALSRFSGCWVGFKAIAETVENAASVELDPDRPRIVVPQDFEPPPGGLHIRWPDPPLEQERRLHGPKMAAVAAFARANAIDRIVLDSPQARFGIMTTGKAYFDVRQALLDLGIDDAAAAALGLRLYKVGLTWPLAEDGARRFAHGLSDILVVEEKRGFIEDQLTTLLFNAGGANRPRVVGKRDEGGRPLLGSEGELSAMRVARAIAARLAGLGLQTPAMASHLARLDTLEQTLRQPPPKVQRTPFFCSGCPHNTSTRLPEGSRAMAGIGCHGMASFMPHLRTETVTQMGGEGANWIGQARFRDEPHIFQNLGDGTYAHSGSLAIRAAAAAGVNITYKILYNDAVAMTGGQAAEGGLSVWQIAQQMQAEGARRIVVVTDDPEKYPPDAVFPKGTAIRHRRELDAVQRELREVRGLSILIYDQTCAAEKRRRRKRGDYPDPAVRVMINEAVCDACGDCSAKSNCISVQPLETEFGRKRTIDQSNCNKDYSCADGFCPSFVTVHGGAVRKSGLSAKSSAEDIGTGLPEPALPALEQPYGMLITGIGGTGILTVGALLGMAAHLEGKGCSVLDFAGMAQKNGAVVSHVRFARTPADLVSLRVAPGNADLVLGCDLLGTASPAALATIARGHTRVLLNSHLQPTAAFVANPELDFDAPAMHAAIRACAGEANLDVFNATQLATRLLGDSIATNLFMLGYAWQKGLLPLSADALMRAVEINGVAVEANRRAFAWGRYAAHDRAAVESIAGLKEAPVTVTLRPGLDKLVARRVAFLTAYQNAAYARRYQELVDATRRAEMRKAPGSRKLAEAVAHNLFRLMAYKDEYEVARLYTDAAFHERLAREFQGDYQVKVHLAPPLLASRDPLTGLPRKKAYGAWIWPVMKGLARLKGLRGTPFDPFGYTAERRRERALIAEYEATLHDILRTLNPDNHAHAVELARVPDMIRGFGHVKDKNIAEAAMRREALLAAYYGASSAGETVQRVSA